jgi:glutamate-1-semialdehyde 2,1-aminomutase
MATTVPSVTWERSRALHAEAVRYLPGGTSRTVQDTKPHPVYASHGSGCELVDVDGNRYVDFYSNASSLVHGHAHPVITRAAVECVERGSAYSLVSEEQVRLARMICDRVGSIDKVRFTNSGTEAVMMAMKLMRAFTGKSRIAKFEGLYHGSSEWAEVSLRPEPANWGSLDAPSSVPYTRGTPPGVLADTLVLPFNDADRTDALLERHRHELAGVVIDVLPIRLGLLAAETGWLRHLREVTRGLDLLLASDEIVTFRLAHGGAQEHFGFDADLTMLGKVIGGGFPVGAVAGRDPILSLFDASRGRPAMPHAGTFNGNPVTMAAGVASLTLLTRAEIDRINQLGEAVRARLTASIEQSDEDAQILGRGSFFQITMTRRRYRNYREYWDCVEANAQTKERQQRLYGELLRRGILLTTSGVGTISTAMDERHVELLVGAVTEIVRSMRA